MSGFTHESTRNESVEWYTPPEIFERLGPFDLDPCSPGRGKSFVPALLHYTIEDDGLAQDWGQNYAWVNPPYGSETGHWMRKLAQHGNGIALVFSRTDVKWFHEIAHLTSAITFVSGRIRFYQGSVENRGGTPGAGSMLLGFGERAQRELLDCDLGITVRTMYSKKEDA